MSKFSLERIDNETPFQVIHTDSLSTPRKPAIILWPTQGYNKKSKALGKGFVFHDKQVAVEILGRFMQVVFMTWPETREQFIKAIKDLKEVKL